MLINYNNNENKEVFKKNIIQKKYKLKENMWALVIKMLKDRKIKKIKK